MTDTKHCAPSAIAELLVINHCAQSSKWSPIWINTILFLKMSVDFGKDVHQAKCHEQFPDHTHQWNLRSVRQDLSKDVRVWAVAPKGAPWGQIYCAYSLVFSITNFKASFYMRSLDGTAIAFIPWSHIMHWPTRYIFRTDLQFHHMFQQKPVCILLAPCLCRSCHIQRIWSFLRSHPSQYEVVDVCQMSTDADYRFLYTPVSQSCYRVICSTI